jgi:hypothetical protein
VPARIPLDVDLEDRLVYGLSPQRFGYAALALLAAMAAWRGLPGLVGQVLAALTAMTGAAFAWGRLGGRGCDAWVLAIVRYGLRTYRLELDRQPLDRLAARLSSLRRCRPRLAPLQRRPPSEWTPRRMRSSPPAPALTVLPSWEPDP